MMALMIEVAPGELLDKLTILEIKLERITDPRKIANIQLEYESLSKVENRMPSNGTLAELKALLKEINRRLWDIEDEIRDLERAKNFGLEFIAVARSVYRTNDERATVKRQINELLKSAFSEEKSYRSY